MKQITRGMVGAVGLAGVGTFFGAIGGTVMRKAAETCCSSREGQLAVYTMSSIGYLALVYPIIKDVSKRVVDWVYEPVFEKYDANLKDLNELLEKYKIEEEES